MDFIIPQEKLKVDKKYVLIQYPGIVKNVDKALQTLGGIQQISHSYHNNVHLELKHTINNPYTSCLVSERKSETKTTSGSLKMVIKVRRKKSDKSDMKISVIGMIDTVFTFDAMCDFQYLPIKRKVQSEYFEDLLPNLIPTSIYKALNWWDGVDKTKTPLFLPPYQFSRYTTPTTKIFAKDYIGCGDRVKKRLNLGSGQNLRLERKALSVTVHAEDEFPSCASSEAIEDSHVRCKNEEPHRLMKQLFEERPMWTRTAVMCKTGLDDNMLKVLLQKFAFYILSGPWGRLWCRFGYDPRTSKESGQYQTIMVTFRNHTKIPERQRLKVSFDRTFPSNTGELGDYQFKKGKLPSIRQMWYSLMDIKLDGIEDLLNDTYAEPNNVALNGWIPVNVIELIRSLIKADVEETILENEEDSADSTIPVDDYF